MSIFSFRQKIGAYIYDVPGFVYLLTKSFAGTMGWLLLCNRQEELQSAPDGRGVTCSWDWTSELYLPRLFPVFGKILYRQALRDFQVNFKGQPGTVTGVQPDISFIIGHRGTDRLPLLLTTLQAIAAQVSCQIECIVVEQDVEKNIQEALPDWVRYIHTPLPKHGMAYCRSWAFNVGARLATSNYLVFHDNDMVVPEAYAKSLLHYFRQGYEVVNLKRFIFYLDQDSSQQMCKKLSTDISPDIISIVQNLEAGGSVAISRKAFFQIGGFDERFVGWGGEDNEFWERALTRRVYPFAFLPVIHLWHSAQKGKKKQDECFSRFQRICQQPVRERIRRLVSCKSGKSSNCVC